MCCHQSLIENIRINISTDSWNWWRYFLSQRRYLAWRTKIDNLILNLPSRLLHMLRWWSRIVLYLVNSGALHLFRRILNYLNIIITSLCCSLKACTGMIGPLSRRMWNVKISRSNLLKWISIESCWQWKKSVNHKQNRGKQCLGPWQILWWMFDQDENEYNTPKCRKLVGPLVSVLILKLSFGLWPWDAAPESLACQTCGTENGCCTSGTFWHLKCTRRPRQGYGMPQMGQPTKHPTQLRRQSCDTFWHYLDANQTLPITDFSTNKNHNSYQSTIRRK
jgi:hypothetical protein